MKTLLATLFLLTLTASSAPRKKVDIQEVQRAAEAQSEATESARKRPGVREKIQRQEHVKKEKRDYEQGLRWKIH